MIACADAAEDLPAPRDDEGAPFIIGQDAQGFWSVVDATGREGGLFASRAAALKFARRRRGRRLGVAVEASAPLSLWGRGA